MAIDLTNLVCLITGAGDGVGNGLVHGFLRRGARVAAGLRDAKKSARLVGEALPLQMDVTKMDEVRAAVAKTVSEYGRVDVLVNNAGIGTAVPATRETPQQFRQVIDVNLNGCYWMAQACGRVMKPGSSIVNISSVLGLTTAGLPQAAYAASKAGLIGLTRDLAQQWTGRKGIRVNALAPGFFASEMTDQYPEGYISSQLGRVLVGREGDPDELAAALVFLVSDAGGYVTGTTLPVEGGLLTS